MFLAWFTLEHFCLTRPKWWQRSPFMDKMTNSYLQGRFTSDNKTILLHTLTQKIHKCLKSKPCICVNVWSMILLSALVTVWHDNKVERCHLILEKNVVVEKPIDLTSLSRKLVDKTVEVIRAGAGDERPFLLYHSFAHTHTPLFTEDRSIFAEHLGLETFYLQAWIWGKLNFFSANKNNKIFGCFGKNFLMLKILH